MFSCTHSTVSNPWNLFLNTYTHYLRLHECEWEVEKGNWKWRMGMGNVEWELEMENGNGEWGMGNGEMGMVVCTVRDLE